MNGIIKIFSGNIYIKFILLLPLIFPIKISYANEYCIKERSVSESHIRAKNVIEAPINNFQEKVYMKGFNYIEYALKIEHPIRYLNTTIKGGAGDMDIYTFLNDAITEKDVDTRNTTTSPTKCKPWVAGSNESCIFTTDQSIKFNQGVGIKVYPIKSSPPYNFRIGLYPYNYIDHVYTDFKYAYLIKKNEPFFFPISKKGQEYYFEFDIPNNAKNITITHNGTFPNYDVILRKISSRSDEYHQIIDGCSITTSTNTKCSFGSLSEGTYEITTKLRYAVSSTGSSLTMSYDTINTEETITQQIQSLQDLQF